MVQFPGFCVACHDAQAKRFIGVAADQIAIIGVLAIQGLCHDGNLVITVVGNAFRKRVNRAIRAFVHVRTRDLVQGHVFELVDPLVDLIYFRLLGKAMGEVPGAGLRLAEGTHGLVDRPVCCVEIPCEQVARGDQLGTDIIQVFARVVAGQEACRIVYGQVKLQQVANRMTVLAGV